MLINYSYSDFHYRKIKLYCQYLVKFNLRLSINLSSTIILTRRDFMDITAYRLRTLREAKGLSQRKVAEYLGITRAAYNQYESGTSKPIRRLEELSNLFGVSADYILGKNETALESDIVNTNAQVQTQVQKYLGLSEAGKDIVDITLDAVYEIERKKKSATNNITD